MRELQVGEHVDVTVRARPRWNDTGVRLVAGGTYDLSAAGTWVDWKETNRCGPDGYASDTTVLRLAERFRLAGPEPWFALIGAVARDRGSQFVIGSGRTYQPRMSGELCCFANDVPLMRWNNKGALTLTVTRTA